MTTLLPAATLVGEELRFADDDGLDRARRHGAFYLKQPEDLDFGPGIRLAQNYYLDPDGGPDDAYRGYRNRDLGKSLMGYSQTGHDQDELLQIESWLWAEYVPETVGDLLWVINDLSRRALSGLFALLDVPLEGVDTITGGMSTNNALQYCIFNHYISTVGHPVGLTAHKDSGFVTTLYTTEAGLESLENNEWVPFDPLEGYFTVVLGHSLEVLTARTALPVSASYHRVRGMTPRTAGKPDRFTFGSYIGPRWDQYLYQYSPEGILEPVEPFLAFQKRKAAEMAYEFHPRVEQALG